jgi:rhodanese-related sulfurtransferase
MRWLCLSVLFAIACSNDKPEKAADFHPPSAEIPTITVAQLEEKLASGECQAVDANAEPTRKKMGVIPGAVLLTDYDTYAARELPENKEKTLVFYCANSHCGASHEAAARALTAGYRHVKVLPDGIAGWVQAGKQVTKI